MPDLCEEAENSSSIDLIDLLRLKLFRQRIEIAVEYQLMDLTPSTGKTRLVVGDVTVVRLFLGSFILQMKLTRKISAGIQKSLRII